MLLCCASIIAPDTGSVKRARLACLAQYECGKLSWLQVLVAYLRNQSRRDTMDWTFELLAGPYGGTTEGPAWDGQALLFTHIPGGSSPSLRPEFELDNK